MCLQPERLRDDAVQARLRALGPDVFVVAAYGKILPQAVLDIPAKGRVNVHASLLPRWRGASPIDSAILAGDAETGVSIMELVMKMDAGPIVSAVRTPILPDGHDGLARAAAGAARRATARRVLPGWLDGSAVADAPGRVAGDVCAR